VEIKEILLNDSKKEDLLTSKGIIVLYTKWCPICKLVMFKLEEVLFDFDITIYKLDVQKNDVSEFGINSKVTPQILVFNESIIVNKYQGMLTDDDVDEIINAINP